MNTNQVASPRTASLVLMGLQLWLSFCLVFCVGCKSEPALQVGELSGPTMGTRYNVRYVASPAEIAASSGHWQQAIDDRLAEINRQMSTYDPQSELSRFNQLTTDEWFDVSSETATVVAYALEVAKDSGGAFDPTVGPVVNLWGFGPDADPETLPTDEQITAALDRVGYQSVEVRLDPPALRKTKPGIYLDLSAVAKGYGVDQISELLTDLGPQASMVDIGGEVVCRGTKPDGLSWRIGILKPDPLGQTVQSVVELTDEAVATSGDYRNFFERNGVRYSHTIDPTTGRPVQHLLATVTVRAENCMMADALATTLLVLGPERGYDWANERGIAALMVLRSESGLVAKMTTAWNKAPSGNE